MGVVKGTGTYTGSTTTSTVISIDADALHGAAEYLGVPADLVSQALNRFRTRTTQIGTIWGDGPVGRSTKAQCQTPYDNMVEFLTDLSDGFVALGDKVTLTANGYLDTEFANQS